ncbi:MAG: quinone oxidoreductase [Bdellovibrio sp.]|nr:MAG: quinone oxidoreductase [Bdellovibrio sp.]
MPHAIRIYEHGGPEKLKWEEFNPGSPGPGEVLVQNKAVGLNFLDTYHRSGLYPIPLPSIIGSEGAGVVTALGPKVKDLKVGDRVAYVDPIGAYSQELIRPADRLVKIPTGVSESLAAAVLLKGMTAEYLLHRTYKVKRGEVILVHAAAGGVGQILCQWARHKGVVVIGTVGSQEKVAIAKKVGCRHVIVTGQEPFSPKVRQLTKGRGVPVVYDGVGKETFMESLDCLSPRGLLVSFGNASGAVPAFQIGILSQKGSLFLTRPSLKTHVERREDLVQSARAVFSAVKSGAVKVSINQTYPLQEAARAHHDLEARRTIGSTVLLPIMEGS